MNEPHRRLIYSSRSIDGTTLADVDSILIESRMRNGLDGITGLLLWDGRSFMQILEGSSDAVQNAFDRISEDERHSGMIVHQDGLHLGRVFGEWTMAYPSNSRDDTIPGKVAVILRNATVEMRDLFSRHLAGRLR